jgi:PAS domain S-box-containing protein
MKSVISIGKRRDGDELVETLTEQLPVGVCVMQDGKFCYVNSTFPIAIGYTVDELIGMDSLQIVMPEDRELVKENTVKMLKGELLAPYQFRVMCKDGSIIWVMAAVKSIDYHGKPAILGNYMEVTERRRMVDALQENEEKFRLLAENSVMGTFVLQDSKMIYVSPTFAKVFGYRPEEIINSMSPSKFVHPDDRDFVMRRLADRYSRTATDNHISLRGVRKDGSTIHIEASSVLTEYRGRPAVMGTFIDVTERKQGEEALRKSEERYRQLAENAGEAIFVVQDGTVKFINSKGEELSGYSLEELTSAPFAKFIHPDDVNMVVERYARRLKGEPIPQTYDFRIVRKDGDIRWGTLSAVSISWDDRPAVLCFMSDITERKRAEEALRQSEERYRTILEEMEDSYFEVDLGGHLTFVNNSVCRDLGYSREELIGMSYKAFTAAEDVDSVFRVFNEVYQTGVPNKGSPWRTVRKDGTHGFAETSISLLRNDKGEITGFRGVGRDITERKQTEEKLRQSRENYRALFDSSVIGALVVDAETMKVVMANQATLKMFGFGSPEEGVNPLDFVPAEDREKSLELIVKEVFEKNSRGSVDLPVITRDGRKMWVSVTGARIMHKGKLAGLFSFTDITERRKMEEALQQSKENYRALFDSSVIGTLVLDAQTMRTVMANQAAAKTFAFNSPEEGIGLSPLDFVPPEDKGRDLEIIVKELFERDLRTTHELRAMTKDGRRIWISVTAARIMHEGKLSGLISFTEITERKQAEEALRQSEENYRVLFDSSVIASVVLDAETMKIVMCNQAALEILGFTSVEEALKAEPFDFIPPEDRERYIDIAKTAVFDHNSHEAYQLRLLTRDGREIWINTTPAKIMHRGKVAALISFTDVTEQKRQREQLIMTDRLASLGELASGAAHELNNPLTSIIGFSQLLVEKEVPDDIREDLNLINSEAQRAANVTRNLLTFARKHAPMKEPNQVTNIIEDVLRLRVYDHKAKHIEVERQFASNLPEVMVDYFQMQQVFMNIIINAEYFMAQAHNRGTLSIATKEKDDTVMILFTDDGPGIAPENLGRIFDPFFTTKEAGQGTGLGLSICHGIVTEHGGRMYARSQLGRGTTIVVELPIRGEVRP